MTQSGRILFPVLLAGPRQPALVGSPGTLPAGPPGWLAIHHLWVVATVLGHVSWFTVSPITGVSPKQTLRK